MRHSVAPHTGWKERQGHRSSELPVPPSLQGGQVCVSVTPVPVPIKVGHGGIAWMPEGWVGQAGGHKDRQWTDGRTDELAELHEEAFHRGAEGAG